MIYLDHAAATPVAPEVLAAMQPYFTDKFHNPSALYLASRGLKNDLEEARAEVALVLGARAPEIVFTSGASEANNLAIHGVMRQYPDGEMLVSAIEHESVWQPSEHYKKTALPVNSKAMVSPEALVRAVSDKTVLISVMYASNEVGTIEPIAKIAAEINRIRQSRQKRGVKIPLLLHCDASQAANYLDLHVSRLGVDLMSLNGGKMYGPKQSGCLYVKTGVKLLPLVEGGGQEWGLRSGTESLALIIGFTAALKRTQAQKKAEATRVERLRDQFWEGVQTIFPKAERQGDARSCLPNILHVRFPGQDNERLVMELDELGVQAAAGSACKASSDEPSRVLLAIGMSANGAGETLRFSLGELTDQKAIDYAIKCLSKILKSKVNGYAQVRI